MRTEKDYRTLPEEREATTALEKIFLERSTYTVLPQLYSLRSASGFQWRHFSAYKKINNNYKPLFLLININFFLWIFHDHSIDSFHPCDKWLLFSVYFSIITWEKSLVHHHARGLSVLVWESVPGAKSCGEPIWLKLGTEVGCDEIFQKPLWLIFWGLIFCPLSTKNPAFQGAFWKCDKTPPVYCAAK